MEVYDGTYKRRTKALKAENATLKEENATLREWMRWILHLQSGVGKNGGPPSSDEWFECLEQGMDHLLEESE